ncbi:hypothetical protein C1H46_045116 [Malus baccata]|uniref:Uncharacterized protein n=1 Tax=Malus baccata TaxID=106549 RepID=A0A540K553_MALBA|nr:hypothetical protein C1H46_045116 [Malus baccata]
MQVQNPHNIKYNGTIQGLKHIWRTEGFRGLFKGNGTNCARIVPNSAVKFFSYEQASKGILWLYRDQTGNDDAQLTPLLRLGAGACAGIIAMSATYPMDMVRGRITVQTENSPFQYRGMFHALSTVLREEGPRALYKGWLPSVIGVDLTPMIYLCGKLPIAPFVAPLKSDCKIYFCCEPYTVNFVCRFHMLVSTLLCMNP